MIAADALRITTEESLAAGMSMQPTVQNQSQFPLSEQIQRDYRILSLIGVGGMGDVYLAEQLHVGKREVALKVLHPSCSEDPDIVERFENEAASAGRIHHHNVVTIYESRVTEDGQIYVAMEYVPGKTLTEILTEQGPLPLARVVDIVKQICAGLGAAHRLGIVHRDVKPDNIMLTDEDGTEVVKILDFGLARISEAISATKRTQMGIILGTPEYMSPEQAAGQTGDHIDARSDVYAVAMLAYEMLTGRPAFKDDNPFEVIKKQFAEKPMPLRYWKHDLQIPEEVEQVLMVALEKDRTKRFQSVVEFARKLSAAASAKAPRTSQKTTLLGGAANEPGDRQTPPAATENKTTLLGGKAKPESPTQQEVNKTTLLGGKAKSTSKPQEEANKTTLLGASRNPAKTPREEENKTTLLGARHKPESPPTADANKTTLLGAQTGQPKSKPASGDVANQTTDIGVKPAAPPPADNAGETITFGGPQSRQSSPPPPPASYETVVDIQSHLSASETQFYTPSHDPPSGFTDVRQPDVQPVKPKPAVEPPPAVEAPVKPAVEENRYAAEMPTHMPVYHQNVAQPARPSAPSERGNKKILWIAAAVAGLLVVAALAWFAFHYFAGGNAKAPDKPVVAGTSLVEYRIKRENPTAELETLAADNRVKAGEGFGFEVRALSPGSVYLFSEQGDGSWRWLNAQRDGAAQDLRVGEWTQMPFGYWLNASPNAGEEKFLIVYVPRGVSWSPASVGATSLTVKNGAADLPREVAANIRTFLQRDALALNSTSEVRDKNVRFSLSKEGAQNRVTYSEISLKPER